MMTFFIRFGIFLGGILVSTGLAGGLHIYPLVVACIFIFAWISVVPFDKIMWWIVAFAVLFGILYYDSFAFYTIIILCVAFLYNVAYTYAVRTANANAFILFIVAFFLAIVAVHFAEIMKYHYIFIDTHIMIATLLWSLFFFFVFRFFIIYAERVVALYNRGIDRRSHT